jgi:16S rRNA (cytidine1402-2'-O)-methyltransferase
MQPFYVVATPIGNLEDMTYRAVRILGEVDTVLCEDTRTTKKLLDHYGIRVATVSYHANSTEAKEHEIVEMIKKGKTLALVSDAGTPCISDPGVRLIRKLYQEFPDIHITPIPGASALISTASVAGISMAEFMFLGFVPHKKGRNGFFERIVHATNTNKKGENSSMPVIFYESTHRIMKTLESLKDMIPDQNIIIGRELTKIHEEIVRGTLSEVYRYFEEHADHQRGEYVVIIDTASS